jgi:hypothetical protein
MKKDVREEESKSVPGFMWYSWIEICDGCGDVIRGHDIRTNKLPNMEEEDYCPSCIEKFYENSGYDLPADKLSWYHIKDKYRRQIA